MPGGGMLDQLSYFLKLSTSESASQTMTLLEGKQPAKLWQMGNTIKTLVPFKSAHVVRAPCPRIQHGPEWCLGARVT